MNLRSYKCLPLSEYAFDAYKLTSIRDEDMYDIMGWRNDQIKILRQKELLTLEQQEKYFKTVVAQLFESERPSQLLFSFFQNNQLIGYGGLVHIDWDSGNAEVSFITETSRSQRPELFVADWTAYLTLLKRVVQFHLGFTKIYTYAFDLRPALYQALLKNSFIEEARLKKHVWVADQMVDVLIHSYFFETMTFRKALPADAELYFHWVNDESVRQNSFNQNQIAWETHNNWFQKKLQSQDSLLLVAVMSGQPVGQIRFDAVKSGLFEIDFSVDRDFRGKGLGLEMIRKASAALQFTRPDARSVIGKVKKTNARSIKAFKEAGFSRSFSELQPDIEIFDFQLK